MTMFADIKGEMMSTIGPRMPWRGSKSPQEGSAFVASEAIGEVVDTDFESPFRRLPPLVPLLGLEPEVPARGRALMPAFKALTRSLQ